MVNYRDQALDRTFAALGKHLEALSDQVGGGFEPEWFRRLFERAQRDLQALTGAQPDASEQETGG